MKIGSVLENQNLEKRIAITPELVKKYTSLGFEVNLIENYGSHLGIKDEQFRDMGVKISKDESEILNVSDIIVQLGMLPDDKISYLKQSFPDSLMVSATRSLQVSDIKDTIAEKYEEWVSALKNPLH